MSDLVFLVMEQHTGDVVGVFDNFDAAQQCIHKLGEMDYEEALVSFPQAIYNNADDFPYDEYEDDYEIEEAP